MSRILGTLLAGSMLAALGAGAANAKAPNDPSALVRGRAAGFPASAPNARLAALVSPFATNFLVRGKGVASVSHPVTGEFCIKPKPALNTNTIVPSVSVDWSTSSGTDNFVQYRSGGSGCPSGQIDVLTFRFDSTVPGLVPDDTVGFTIVVP